MSSNSAQTKAHFLLDVEFEVNDHAINGVYSPTMGVLAGRVDDLNLKALAPDDLAEFIPDITINSVQAMYDTKNKSSFLTTDLDLDLSLHDVPLIGSRIPAADKFGLSDLSVVISNKNGKTGVLIDADLNILKYKVPLVFPLTKDSANVATDNGATYRASTGNTSTKVNTSFSTNTSTSTNSEVAGDSSRLPVKKEKTKSGLVKWFDVNKSIGPGQLKRIGLQFIEGKLFFLLDMKMSMGPLSIGLDGLAVGSSINKLNPEFKLSGLSISYTKGQTSITGAFLYDEIDDSYQGLAMIKVPSFSIAALGAYKEFNGQPSLFIYGVLDLAIGVGPPFLQLSGVSAGFGYNRTLNIPEVSKVQEFPLVSAVMGQDLGAEPLAVLSKIKTYIPSASGELFFAFGIKFNSFKLVDAFALLLLRLGNKIKLDILGLARVSVPNKIANPLAMAELALKASYDFEEKVLKVAAELTPASFILSRKCRLTGGFAFYSWFAGEHAGNFVLTMGGYHPDFKVPPYYPRVPRLGFHWQLSSSISLKGEMYYALVPSALMAGGSFKALFEEQFSVGFDIGIAGATLSGKVKAYFIIGADFIIGWQPFFYDAQMYINVGITASFSGKVKFLFFTASKTLRFDLSLSANLHIWGPEFSGLAHVDWSVVSFDIAFGAGHKVAPKPVSWSQFKAAFLPASDSICQINVAEGLLRQLNSNTNPLNIIEPANLAINTNSVIPSTQSTCNGIVNAKPFGIAPMAVSQVASSEHHIHIVKNQDEDVTNQFDYFPIKQSAPKALWGNEFKTDINGGLVDELTTGYQIKPKPKVAPDQTEDKPLRDFAYDIELKDNAFAWTVGVSFTSVNYTPEQAMDILMDEKSFRARDQALRVLNLAFDEVNLKGLTQDNETAFLTPPQIMKQQPLAA